MGVTNECSSAMDLNAYTLSLYVVCLVEQMIDTIDKKSTK